MKRITSALITAALSLAILAGCGAKPEAPKADAPTAPAPATAAKPITLKVGATDVPHSDILKFAKPLAEKEGINLDVVTFADYTQINTALNDKQLDADFFQHLPYLAEWNSAHKAELVGVGGIHLEPLGLYSSKATDLKSLKDGATITLPDDATNEGRALNLLAGQGLIKLKDGVGFKATPKDIAENTHNFKFKPMAAEQLPRTLQDADAAVVNTNYYLEAQKNQGVKASVLAREATQNNPYVNIIAVRKGDETRPEIKALLKVLQSNDVKQFIEKQYGGAVIAAF